MTFSSCGCFHYIFQCALRVSVCGLRPFFLFVLYVSNNVGLHFSVFANVNTDIHSSKPFLSWFSVMKLACLSAMKSWIVRDISPLQLMIYLFIYFITGDFISSVCPKRVFKAIHIKFTFDIVLNSAHRRRLRNTAKQHIWSRRFIKTRNMIYKIKSVCSRWKRAMLIRFAPLNGETELPLWAPHPSAIAATCIQNPLFLVTSHHWP